jgi:hypothetical protein
MLLQFVENCWLFIFSDLGWLFLFASIIWFEFLRIEDVEDSFDSNEVDYLVSDGLIIVNIFICFLRRVDDIHLILSSYSLSLVLVLVSDT